MTTIESTLGSADLEARLAAAERRLADHDEAARARIAELTKVNAELEAKVRALEATFESLPDGVVVMDVNGQLLHINAAAVALFGADDAGGEQPPPSGHGIFRADGVTRVPPEEYGHVRAMRGEAVDGEIEEIFVRNHVRPDGVWLLASTRLRRGERGAYDGASIILRDINDRKRWEQEMKAQLEREREKNETLQRLRFAVQELSTPVLEVWDDILALPVVGIVDSRRSVEMMDRLLQEVTAKQCRFVIIDITGVEVVDTSTADRFIKLVRAVELLGARCVLTGVRSAVAQTLVNLGLDLGPLLTLRTLKHGLRECLRAMESEPQRVDPKALLLRTRISV